VNGAGKSTIFKAIMGFVPCSSGHIKVLGDTVQKALKSNLIAYVPQSEEVDWTFPVLVKDVVMMGRYGHMGFLRIPSKKDFESVENALAKVGMVKYAKQQIGELSGGQRKRVFLARSIAQNSHIILLDEPFTGVDVQTEEAIVDLLKKMKVEGKVVLVSTHNLGSVPEFCDHVVIVNETVLNYGPIETNFTHQYLEKAFGGVLRHLVISGKDLHDDEDHRQVSILTDDERPFVTYDGKHHTIREKE
jgi:manganese/iron transport system ATP-binding protein